MKGRISSFQSLGTVDGPGVRSVVFMQGCPLRCACCHNPETWSADGGEETDTDELIRKILRFRLYYGKEGGVTVSGGEPLTQAPFVRELFAGLKNAGIGTALDTSGCLSGEAVSRVLDHTDLVILDHKYSREEDYRRYTGGSLRQTERFLDELDERRIPVWLRRVIIPGLNDREQDVLSLKETAGKHPCVVKTELLPFRKLCLEKYASLGIAFPLAGVPEPSEADMERLSALL